MCSPEEAALLRLEGVFSDTLTRINSLVLQPLLEAGLLCMEMIFHLSQGPARASSCFLEAPEASDPWGRECLQLLQQLQRSSRQLWDVTEESLRSLRERLRRPEAVGLESLLLLHSADRVLQVHLE
ncbi:hypothetical protein Celaphus_00018242 [Cervus elaphus hippelaphus]|uniref:Uncharacterized protein n=1 Tax=Cervus elaphus hippelaphus TaxID=46360 RepID=A0A212C575_CEREH|nr:hypothetical protein Celaphus_00018242 [Cervus elaphus hippelaphus]